MVYVQRIPAAGRAPDVFLKSLIDHGENSCMDFSSEQAERFKITDITSQRLKPRSHELRPKT